MRLPFRFVFLVLAFLLAAAGVFLQWGEAFELTTLDWRYRHRNPPRVRPEIVIIEIGEDTLQRIGQWPISREWHTQLIRALKEAGARSVLLNLLFIQPSEHDSALKQAMLEANNVYLPVVALSGYREEPLESTESLTSAARGVGHVNVLNDRDGKIRRLPFKYGGHFTLPFLMLEDQTGAESLSFLLDLDERGDLLINFAGRWSQTFRHYSYLDIIESYAEKLRGEEPKIPLQELEGAVCFVGLTAAGTEQTLSVPLESHFPMIGVFANVYNMFLERKWLVRVHPLPRLVIAWLFLLVGLLAPYFGKRLRSLLVLIVIAAGYFLVVWWFFAWFGVWLDLVYPLGLLGIAGVVSLTRQAVAQQHQQEILRRELDVAYQIQQLFLPSPTPQTPGLSIAAKMIPARHIGGDFYDLVPCGNDSFAIMIGDVSGKGIPAALCMALLSSEFKTLIQRETKPEEVLKKLNRLLWEKRLKVFVTLSLLIYQRSKGVFSYVNAGHLPPLKVNRQSREIESLDLPSGPPLGAAPQASFPESMIEAGKQTDWILYTDGIVEAKNRSGEFFGEERFRAEIAHLIGKPVSELLESLIARAMEFQVGKDPSDDLTLLVVNSE